MTYQAKVITPVVDTDKEALVSAYTQALADLQAIQNATTFTTAQRDAAIKKLAAVDEKILRFLKNLIG